MRSLLRDRLIVGILIFVALCSPDFGLSWCFIRCFCPRRLRSVHSVSKVLSFRFSRIETRLRHVTRPKILAHHDYLSKLHQECDMLCINKPSFWKYRRICNNLLVKLLLKLQMCGTAQILQACFLRMALFQRRAFFIISIQYDTTFST